MALGRIATRPSLLSWSSGPQHLLRSPEPCLTFRLPPPSSSPISYRVCLPTGLPDTHMCLMLHKLQDAVGQRTRCRDRRRSGCRCLKVCPGPRRTKLRTSLCDATARFQYTVARTVRRGKTGSIKRLDSLFLSRSDASCVSRQVPADRDDNAFPEALDVL